MKRTFVGLLAFAVSSAAWAQNYAGYTPSSQKKQEEIEKKWLETTDFSRFRTHLTALTSVPHPAGSTQNEKVRDYLVETMEKAGWKSTVYPYDILLPKEPGYSSVSVVAPIRIPLNNQEYVLPEDPYSAHPDLWPGWNAWSGAGNVTAEVVYANYGTKADFERLEKEGIDIKGKIVLARYGGNFRGYKAKFAEQYGAAGLIIYTDPADAGYMKGLVYPQGVFYNESSIQRGSLLTLDFTGDALTPFEPALPLDGTKKIKRLNQEEVGLHTIPVTSLPYGSVKEIFARMTGKPVPAGWQGGLPYTYRLTGGADLKVNLNVQQKKDMVRVYDVIGKWEGTENPDEWIIMGCHYDAWSFGSTDPNSGTAMMLALAESMNKLAQQGIKPKRSILIGHWDAEEHGVIGSTEWVEQMHDELKAKAVTYINLDAAVSGRNFGASASPSMKQVILETTQKISFPDSSKTLFDVWKGAKKQEPTIGNLGGGSDHIAFYMHVGVPSLNAGVGGPTLYHTNYDNLTFYEKFAEPSFQMGGMMEQWVGLLSLRLANADVLPYDIPRYATDLKTHFEAAEKQVKGYSPDFKGFAKVQKEIKELDIIAQAFDKAMAAQLKKQTKTAAQMQQINAKLRALEKAFIDEKGMYFGSWYRSLYASSDPFSGYASWVLPGIQYEIEGKKTDKLTEWDGRYAGAIQQLKNQISELNQLLK
ncbi:MAG: M28 family peptidase [Spirosomataceae bacterium]